MRTLRALTLLLWTVSYYSRAERWPLEQAGPGRVGRGEPGWGERLGVALTAKIDLGTFF